MVLEGVVPVAVVVKIAVGVVVGNAEVTLPGAALETGELMGLMDDDVVVTGTRDGTIPALGVVVPSRRGTPLAEADPTELESDNTEVIPIDEVAAEVAGIRLIGVVAGVVEDGGIVLVLLLAATFDVALALTAFMGFSAVVLAVVTLALPIVNGITLVEDEALDFFVDEALDAVPPLRLELLRLSSVDESSLLAPAEAPEVVFLVG